MSGRGRPDGHSAAVPATIREAYVQASSFLRSAAEQSADERDRAGRPEQAFDAPALPFAGERRDGDAGTRDEAANLRNDAAHRVPPADSGPRTQDTEQVVLRLLAHLAGWSRGELLMRWNEPFPSDRWEDWSAWLRRKAQGEPVQYITGEETFYGLSFRVTPAVLIPRPETELLVERMLEEADRIARRPSSHARGAPVLVDIGTGSGAIAVTFAHLRPEWRVVATDVSEEALRAAESNAARHGVAERIRFLRGDLWTPVAEAGIRADIVVSNPPYVPAGDIPRLMREVRDYEPKLALDGGDDGLALYRRLFDQMRTFSRDRLPRAIGLETGAGQARAVADMMRGLGAWDVVDIVCDLSGLERHVIGIRPD